MINDSYVSFDVAKLLKKKGFDGYCANFYKCPDSFWEFKRMSHSYSMQPICPNEYILAPSLSQAMRWFREVHGLHISPEHKAFYDEHAKKSERLYYHWCPKIEVLPSRHAGWGVIKPHGADGDDFYHEGYKATFDTYEDAVNECIKYCLDKLV